MVASDTPLDPPDRPEAGTADRPAAPSAGADALARGAALPAPEPAPRPEPSPASPESRPAAPRHAASPIPREQAQIERLEQFRLAIERLRREREATIAEFRAFVRGGAAAARRGAELTAMAAAAASTQRVEQGEAAAERVEGAGSAPVLDVEQRVAVAGLSAEGLAAETMPPRVEAPAEAAGVSTESTVTGVPVEAPALGAGAVPATPSAESEAAPPAAAAKAPLETRPAAVEEKAVAAGSALAEEGSSGMLEEAPPAEWGFFGTPQLARSTEPTPQPVLDIVEPQGIAVPPRPPSPPSELPRPVAGPGPFLSATLEEPPAPSVGRRIAIWTTGLLAAAAAVFLFVRPVGEPPGSAPTPGAVRVQTPSVPGSAAGAGPAAESGAAATAAPTAPETTGPVSAEIERGPATAGAQASPATAPAEPGPAGAGRAAAPGTAEAGRAAPLPTPAAGSAAPLPAGAGAAAATGTPAQPVAPAGAGIAGASSQLAPLRVEIVTERPVWIRAVADEVRRFERLVPENQRIRIDARTFVQLRIGDAGAVRLVVNGVDRGIQGRDGQVITRRFDAGADATVPR
jgi:hypothetical protein